MINDKALIIACYIVKKNLNLDHLKLHQIMYYAHVKILLECESSLFRDIKIKAYQYGPVIEELYFFIKDKENLQSKNILYRKELKTYLFSELSKIEIFRDIKKEDKKIEEEIFKDDDQKECKKKILDFIIDKYYNVDSIVILKKIYLEEVWYKNLICDTSYKLYGDISDDDIKKYFRRDYDFDKFNIDKQIKTLKTKREKILNYENKKKEDISNDIKNNIIAKMLKKVIKYRTMYKEMQIINFENIAYKDWQVCYLENIHDISFPFELKIMEISNVIEYLNPHGIFFLNQHNYIKNNLEEGYFYFNENKLRIIDEYEENEKYFNATKKAFLVYYNKLDEKDKIQVKFIPSYVYGQFNSKKKEVIGFRLYSIWKKLFVLLILEDNEEQFFCELPLEGYLTIYSKEINPYHNIFINNLKEIKKNRKNNNIFSFLLLILTLPEICYKYKELKDNKKKENNLSSQYFYKKWIEHKNEQESDFFFQEAYIFMKKTQIFFSPHYDPDFLRQLRNKMIHENKNEDEQLQKYFSLSRFKFSNNIWEQLFIKKSSYIYPNLKSFIEPIILKKSSFNNEDPFIKKFEIYLSKIQKIFLIFNEKNKKSNNLEENKIEEFQKGIKTFIKTKSEILYKIIENAEKKYIQEKCIINKEQQKVISCFKYVINKFTKINYENDSTKSFYDIFVSIYEHDYYLNILFKNYQEIFQSKDSTDNLIKRYQYYLDKYNEYIKEKKNKNDDNVWILNKEMDNILKNNSKDSNSLEEKFQKFLNEHSQQLLKIKLNYINILKETQNFNKENFQQPKNQKLNKDNLQLIQEIFLLNNKNNATKDSIEIKIPYFIREYSLDIDALYFNFSSYLFAQDAFFIEKKSWFQEFKLKKLNNFNVDISFDNIEMNKQLYKNTNKIKKIKTLKN